MTDYCFSCNDTGLVGGKPCPECLPTLTTAELVQTIFVLLFLLFTIIWLWTSP